MREFLYDWKHAISADNTSGSRRFFIMLTVVLPVIFFGGIVGLALGIIKHMPLAIIICAICLVVSIVIVGVLVRNK